MKKHESGNKGLHIQVQDGENTVEMTEGKKGEFYINLKSGNESSVKMKLPKSFLQMIKKWIEKEILSNRKD